MQLFPRYLMKWGVEVRNLVHLTAFTPPAFFVIERGSKIQSLVVYVLPLYAHPHFIACVHNYEFRRFCSLISRYTVVQILFTPLPALYALKDLNFFSTYGDSWQNAFYARLGTDWVIK